MKADKGCVGKIRKPAPKSNPFPNKIPLYQEQNPLKSIKLVILCIFTLFFSFLNAFADNPPPGQEAGAQAERFKSESELEKQRLQEKKTKAPKIEIETKEAKPSAAQASFVLEEARITGATIFQPEAFREIYQPYLSKEVTLKDINLIIEKIKAKYKEKGYLTTIVYLPEQEIKAGVVEIRVVEGKMGKLNIEGNKYFSSALIEKYFHTERNENLNIYKVQRDILRLNKNPDLEVRTVISNGDETGASDVTLKVKDKFPWHTGISADNLGTRLTGKYREGVYVRSTNTTGQADSIFVNSIFSSLTFGESVSYSRAIGTYGTKFGLDFTYFNNKLGKEFKSFDITGNTLIFNPYVSWELCLTEDFEAYSNVGMEIKSIKKHQLGSITSNDQLREPYFAFEFTETDSSGQTAFSPKFNFNTENFLGASERNHPTASRAGTGGFFFKYEQSVSRIQRMPFESYATLRSQLQAASHTLPSSEQYQLGGMYSIRGYPEGDYLADMGGSLNCDWVFPMYLIPSDWTISNTKTPLRYQIEPVLFADIGGGKLKKVLTGERKDKFLAGVGGGLRIRLNNNINARLEWAKRIGDRATGGSGPSTFHFTVQMEI